MPAFQKPEANPSFPALEQEVLQFWRDHQTFARQLAQGDKDFVFYDGPPFATGTPHYGHLLAGTLKDIVPRYWAMRGYRVERRFGWDTHGLPVEMEIEKEHGIKSPSEVRAFGIDKYNEACRSIVLRYTGLWRQTVERMGRWVDFDNDYKTMDPTFMESVWWVFAQLWDKGLIYQGYKVMPYSWRLGTPLSNFEAGMDYRTVQDPAVTVRFPLRPGQQLPDGRSANDVSILAWTTTPWTLPSNMALCVGPEIVYVLASPKDSAETLLLAAPLADKVLGAGWTQHAEYVGSALVGLTYDPPFGCYLDARDEGAFRVIADGYVTTEDGTGVVHTAPAFGEDDWRIAQAFGVPLRDAVDLEGKFTSDVAGIDGGSVVGLTVKEADRLLIRALKDSGRLFKQATLDHEYPFCWRSGTPLIYKAMPTWFVKVSAIKDRMVELNQQTRWVPDYVGDKRFGNWLRDARDWAISRNRFWGTPLPVWVCDNCGAREVIGSIADLQRKSGQPVTDLHMHHVDPLTWTCSACAKADSGSGAGAATGAGCGTMRRIPEVLDCWFESGAMPYAQNHYPFENKELVEQNLPAEFIAEGLDQTRGWFYTLLVLSTALFDRPAFRNVIVNGLILAEDGQKMSKRLKNYPDPGVILETYGADALRAYLSTSPAVRAEPMRFAEAGVREVVRSVVLPLWNAYAFFATYAAVDGWQPGKTIALADRSLLDRWILSVVQSVVADVNREMQAYRLYNVIPRVLGILDDLTNWYIRRSRRRFWKSESDADKAAAFATLYEVLTLLSRLLAPILPFMAEVLYQRLEAGFASAEGDKSVHLQRFPNADASLQDEGLEARMALVRSVVRLGRNLREQTKINVRQPLQTLTVALQDGASDPQYSWLADHPELVEIIADELNVKVVSVDVDGPGHLVERKAVLNFKAAAKKLGAQTKAVAAALQALTSPQVAALQQSLAAGTASVEGAALLADDVEIRVTPRAGLTVAAEGRLTVALDTALTEPLRREGLARELVNRIQNLRKDTGLEVEERMALTIATSGTLLPEVVAEHRAYLETETLAQHVHVVALDDASDAVELAGERVALRIARL